MQSVPNAKITMLSGLQASESIVIYGAGPVGLIAAYPATLLGTSKVFVADEHAGRLKLAESLVNQEAAAS